MGLHLEKSQLVSAGFKGQVLLPVTKEDETFSYQALIEPRNANYSFVISNDTEVSFPVLKASKVTLEPNSYLEVKTVNGKFMPKAVLNGSMDIASPVGSAEEGDNENIVQIPSLRFSELTLTSVAPYMTVGAFGFDGTASVQRRIGGFNITIDDVGLQNYEDGVSLDFDLIVNFVPSADNGFGASASLSIVGAFGEEGNYLSWRYKHTELHEAHLDIDQGPFALKGSAYFFKRHEVYGKGFQGLLTLKITPGGNAGETFKLEVKATALFGTTPDEVRYWYADAAALFSPAIKTFPGFDIAGFSGALYYHMKPEGQAPAGAQEIGVTQTGNRYVPEASMGLGLEAGLSFQGPKKEAYHGDVMFSILFNQRGGLARVALDGNCYFMTRSDTLDLSRLKGYSNKIAQHAEKLHQKIGGNSLLASQYSSDALTDLSSSIFGLPNEQVGKSEVSASAHIEYNFNTSTLDANFKVYINVAGGIVKGVGPGGLAGWALMHFSPAKWYVLIGTPEQRNGVEFAGLARATAYLMAGHDLPGAPPPPAEVASILGTSADELDYMRDLNKLQSGLGFALGADMRIDTGNLQFLMFYARFVAGAGFDIMVKDYKNTRCVGASSPIGIKGWYANGQIYAYLKGDIGMQVRLRFYKGKFKILSIAAAVLLQAKLPNPTWVHGMVGGALLYLGRFGKRQLPL